MISLKTLSRSLFYTCLMTPILTSCGGGSSDHQVVTDVALSASTTEGDVYAGVSADFDLGNMTLPTLQFPVRHPQTGEVVGEINLMATLDGKNVIELNVNVTEIAQINPVTSATLPNGQAIPVGGIDPNAIISMPIDSINSQVYLAMAPQTAMAGFAISISQFDGIGGEVGDVNFFPAFSMGEVRGVAGLFTGSNSGENGLALFVDLSSVIDPDNFLEDLFIQKSAELAVLSRSSKSVQTPFYIDQTPGGRTKSRIEKSLFKLHRKSIELKVK